MTEERGIFHDWKHAFDEKFERKFEKARGLTKKQRDWVIRAWDRVFEETRPAEGLHICAFPVERDERVVLHGWEERVQVHHIVPKGYAKNVLGWDDAKINSPTNLIPLCEEHHIGRGWDGSLDWRNDLVPVVHPDMEWARRKYQGKEKKPTSYDFVFEGRSERMANGETYWNTDFDWPLAEKAREVVQRYRNILLENGEEDPWPERK